MRDWSLHSWCLPLISLSSSGRIPPSPPSQAIGSGPPPVLSRVLSFAPQAIIQLALSLSFHNDLPFCFFAQTFAFVTFNKVRGPY